MNRISQWFLTAIGAVALVATAQANPPSYSNATSSRPTARPASRGYSSVSDAGYRGAPSFRPPTTQNYGGRMPAYGGQRFSPMAPRMTGNNAVRSFGGTRTYSGGQRFSSMGTADRSWRETFPRSNSQHRSTNGSQSDLQRRTTPTTPTRDTDGLDRMKAGSTRGTNLQNTRTNRSTQLGNVNRGSTTTQKAVFDRRSANWQPNWDRNRDHWWNGHRCRFINGSWVIFNLGFYPWWPIGYPFDYYYGYGYYPYDYYGYGYGYDPGYYGYGDSGYYGQDDYYGQDGSGAYGQNGDASVAAAQEQLARMGYYRGSIDGVFGPETEQAVRAFQRDRGLNANGYLTLETRQALGVG
jgi:hypothetical protein